MLLVMDKPCYLSQLLLQSIVLILNLTVEFSLCSFDDIKAKHGCLAAVLLLLLLGHLLFDHALWQKRSWCEDDHVFVALLFVDLDHIFKFANFNLSHHVVLYRRRLLRCYWWILHLWDWNRH